MIDKYKLVCIGHSIYVQKVFDPASRYFQGWRLTKDDVNNELEDKESTYQNNFVSIMFTDTEKNIHISQAEPKDFKKLWYVYRPLSAYDNSDYEKAIARIKKEKAMSWWERFLNRFTIEEISLSYAKRIIKTHEEKMEWQEAYKLEVAERDAWIDKIREKWFK